MRISLGLPQVVWKQGSGLYARQISMLLLVKVFGESPRSLRDVPKLRGLPGLEQNEHSPTLRNRQVIQV